MVALLAMVSFDMSVHLVTVLVDELDLTPRAVILEGLERIWEIPVVLLLLELDLMQVLWHLVVVVFWLMLFNTAMLVVVVVLVVHTGEKGSVQRL